MERRPDTLAAAVDGWLFDLRLAGRSPGTLKTYRYVMPAPDLPLADFDDRWCRAFLADRMAAGLQLSSVKSHWAALSSFSSWCVSQGHLTISPMAKIPCPKPREKPHRFLSTDELRRIWAAAASGYKREETRLIIALLIEGLRANELCSLRWQDLRSDRIVVAFGKGGKVRAVPLRALTRRLLEERQQDSGRIFAFTRQSLHSRLQRLGIRAGVPNLHPHAFRHAFASLSLLAGMDEGTLRTLGGWGPRSQMVEKYIRSAREDAAIRQGAGFDLTELLEDPR